MLLLFEKRHLNPELQIMFVKMADHVANDIPGWMCFCDFQIVELNHKGANLLATDQYGMTALHHAARFGHKGVVKYLIDNGKISFCYIRGGWRFVEFVLIYCKLQITHETLPKLPATHHRNAACH